MLNAFVGVALQDYVSQTKSSTDSPLMDLGFNLVPYISSSAFGVPVPDLCSLGSATIIAISLVIQFEPFLSAIILRRVLVITAIAYLGRAISVPMTLLPNPDPDCIPYLIPDSLVLSALSIPFGTTVTCSDVFYSGHVVPITCALMVWIDYMKYSAMRSIGMLFSIIALVGIIATRFHYTIDVFYGFMVTVVLWKVYHFALTCPSVFLHFRSFTWWESDAALPLEPHDVPASMRVVEMDLSRDPRILWAFAEKPALIRRKSQLSRSQMVLLVVVAMTLSPSWIAVYQKSTR